MAINPGLCLVQCCAVRVFTGGMYGRKRENLHNAPVAVGHFPTDHCRSVKSRRTPGGGSNNAYDGVIFVDYLSLNRLNLHSIKNKQLSLQLFCQVTCARLPAYDTKVIPTIPRTSQRFPPELAERRRSNYRIPNMFFVFSRRNNSGGCVNNCLRALRKLKDAIKCHSCGGFI